MSHAAYMRELLRPLGAYDLEATFNGAELTAVGEALDGVLELVEELEREMSLVTAEDWGLQLVGDLFSVRPMAEGVRALAEAYAALMRVSGDSATLAKINDTVGGCGVYALVTEEDPPNHVKVSFPNVAGYPVGYDEIKHTIDSILPAQADVYYDIWYRDWQMLRDIERTWAMAEDGYSWYTLSTGVK